MLDKETALAQIKLMNEDLVTRVTTKHEEAVRKGQADDSPLLKVLESRNVAKVARQLAYWYEQATKNGHYKKGNHRYLVNLINRMQELFPSDELATYIGKDVQYKQPEFSFLLLAGITYKMGIATGFNHDGDQQWKPLKLVDKIIPRLEIVLIELLTKTVSPYVSRCTSAAINAQGRSFNNRREAWKKVQVRAIDDALGLLSQGKGKGTTAAGLEALRAPLDYMFPPDACDDLGRNLYNLKQAVLFIVVDALSYSRQPGDPKYDEKLASHFPFVFTREDPGNKYSQRMLRVNPAIKRAKDAVLDRMTVDENALEPETDIELLAEFFVFKATPYRPEPWKFTGMPDRVNQTGGFSNSSLRSLCSLHRRRGSESDSVASKDRIDFINRLQDTEYEVNGAVYDLAVHLHDNEITIDGLASRHPVNKNDIKSADWIACAKEPRINAKREALTRYERIAVERGMVCHRDDLPTDDAAAAYKAREETLKVFRNSDEFGEEWRNIRRDVTNLADEITKQNDNAINSDLALAELKRLRELPKFHYVVQVDGRHRVYFVAANSSPLAGNLNRWCHQFHRGKPLTDAGWQELLLAIGTACLGNKLSINERRDYARQNLDKFTGWGQNLIENEREIRHLKPDEFWYFCALINGLAEYKVTGVWKVPVARDAAASGLGWWSVLTGDESGAKICNLIDTDEDSGAGDAYVLLLNLVNVLVKARDKACIVSRKTSPKSKKFTTKRYSQAEWDEIDALMEQLPKLRAGAKSTVMLKAYGAGHLTCLDGVKEALPWLSDFQQVFLTVMLSRAMQQVFSGCYAAMLGLKEAYSNTLMVGASAETQELVDKLSILQKELNESVKDQKVFIADYDASCTPEDQVLDAYTDFESTKVSPVKARLRVVLQELAVERFADEQRNGPMTWTQVDGSVVHHCKLMRTISNLSMPGHGEIKFAKYHTETRDGMKGRVAVAPDFIHSCDSLQLGLAFKDITYDVLTIHDCCYIHPNEMGDALDRLKQAMITIVKQNPLQQLLQSWGSDVRFPTIENFEQRVMSSKLYWN